MTRSSINDLLLSICLNVPKTFNNNFAPEFAKYTLVKPKIFHAREKREIFTTKENDGNHVHDLKIALEINGKEHLLNLKLNREFIPKGYFHRYQHKGKSIVEKPKIHEIELCHYQGSLHDVEHSWAAISTCDNKLSGVIFDGNELHYIESTKQSNNSMDDLENFNDHYLYKHSDLIEKKKCGYEGSNIISPFNTSSSDALIDNHEFNRILRYKRSIQPNEKIRGPYNANNKSRFVELVLVVDRQTFVNSESNLRLINNRCKNIANILNALYSPLNIFIALVGVVVWTEVDEIEISAEGDTTLRRFLHYRRKRLVTEHPNDNAQLITGSKFMGGVVGKSLKGPICTYEYSGGVSSDYSNSVGVGATTIAHQMGHNFGMEHDSNDCECPDDQCIMSPSILTKSPTHWSSCSIEYLANAFAHGMDYCLRNKPEHLFDSPVCGNGFVEPGEQCDCGLVDNCQNPCCNATTCMLHSNASCATGECCDLVTCRPKISATLCRSADHECDLPEYCTGQSEYCPNDVYKMDTETCEDGQSFCYQGSCRTHSDQCKILWGPSAFSGDDKCYQQNSKGTRHGNCGYNRLNSSYIKCKEEDLLCGMLHCNHLNDRLEFGLESVAVISQTFIQSNGSIISCRTALVDLGLNNIDPGLTPNGAKCGEGKMCIDQKCVEVKNLKKIVDCPNNCNGNGFCNNKGHCHCKDNFAPPYCELRGSGGSVDSGPAPMHVNGNHTANTHINNTEQTVDEKDAPILSDNDPNQPLTGDITSRKDLQVVFRTNRTGGIVKPHEVDILSQHIVEEMLRAMNDTFSNSTRPEYHFRNTSIVAPGWFLITAEDEVSRDWILTKYQTLVIEGLSFSAIKAIHAPWMCTIGFSLTVQEIDIVKETNILRLQNRQLNVDSWNFVGKQGGPGSWFLLFQVNKNTEAKLNSTGWALFYKLMKLPVYKLQIPSNFVWHTTENGQVDIDVKQYIQPPVLIPPKNGTHQKVYLLPVLIYGSH